MAFSISPTAIPPTKFMQSGCAEEMLSPTFAEVASTTPRSVSHRFAPIRRRQSDGTISACCATPTAPCLV
ncbi:hypothetical protein TIFTF001_018944 [Ficus carica]|uniref:Uncharacterized protein n=1 Tax=Ficus carica TaxID=3494 RepID=A0AA88ADE9_FICCA|nr:hypothetical protein TIFTF001_018944 [Ficus carica]